MDILSLTEDQLQEGLVLRIDKPKGWSSFDVIRWLKKMWKIRKLKIGHAGTLDPLATGLLIVCTGKKTKIIQSIQDAPKEYQTTIYLGGTTQTYDSEGEIEHRRDATNITLTDIQNILPSFLGSIQQIPPIYSAIRINGKRAYEQARLGKNVELKARTVEVFNIQIESFKPALSAQHDFAVLEITVSCSKGTYIRSLAHDIGKALKVGGFIHDLRRTRIGDYILDTHSINPLEPRLANHIPFFPSPT